MLPAIGSSAGVRGLSFSLRGRTDGWEMRMKILLAVDGSTYSDARWKKSYVALGRRTLKQRYYSFRIAYGGWHGTLGPHTRVL